MYLPFGKSVIQRRMSYKIGFLMRIIGRLIEVSIMYFLWIAIFNSSKSGVINGFNKEEIVIYILMSFITTQLISVNMDWTISDDIVTGSIATNLIKPISYEKRILSESLGNVVLDGITITLPLWIIFYAYNFINKGTLPPNIGTILLFILSLVLGYLVVFIFNFIFSISAFFVTYMWGFLLCKSVIISFFSGQLLPIAFFPNWLQEISKFLPFSSMNYTPVMIYMDKLSTRDIIFSLCVQVAWIVILYAIYRVLWAKAMKRVTVLGG